MVCSKCGAQNPEDANFCISCGSQFIKEVKSGSVVTDLEYASFGQRFVALIIDGLILGLSGFILGAIVGGIIGLVLGLMGVDVEAIQGIAGGVGYILGITLNWLYYTILESSKWQATFGKKALNLVVTDVSGDKITFGRANGRYWSKFISILILCIGYLMAAFTEKHQALHDMIADTLVIKKK